MSSDVLAVGAKCSYRDTASGTDLVAHVLKVHYDDVPPYYTVSIEGRSGERETIRSRLTAFATEPAEPVMQADDEVANLAHLLELTSIVGAVESASRVFKDIDTDGDGAVTRRELRAYFTAHGRDPDVAEALFAALDTDGDGLCDYEEFRKLYQAAQRHSGALDAQVKEQWRVLFAAAGGADELFGELDSDRDGCITRRELATYLVQHGGDGAFAGRLLAAVDGDKDGLIDRTEMREAFAWASEDCVV